MDAVSGECIEIDGKGGDERLAFAGLHLGDAAFVQHHAADQLHVEMALTERPLGGLANGGEGFGDQIFERRAVLYAFLERLGAGAQSLVRELLDLRFESVDLSDDGWVFLELALVRSPEDLAGNRAEGKHYVEPLNFA